MYKVTMYSCIVYRALYRCIATQGPRGEACPLYSTLRFIQQNGLEQRALESRQHTHTQRMARTRDPPVTSRVFASARCLERGGGFLFEARERGSEGLANITC